MWIFEIKAQRYKKKCKSNTQSKEKYITPIVRVTKKSNKSRAGIDNPYQAEMLQCRIGNKSVCVRCYAESERAQTGAILF